MYPKVRFRGFDEPWKTKNVSSTFDIITDYVANGSFESLRKNVVTYKSYNYAYMIRLQDASNNWQGPWLYTDKKGYNFLSKSKLFPGDIVMSNVGSVGLFYLIPDLGKPMTLAPNSILLRSSFENNRFLFSLMNSNLIKTQIEKEKSPGAQPKINKTDFKKIKLVIPQRTEQNVIANLFKVIDSLLSLQQRKLELEKQIKTAILQKYFSYNNEMKFKNKLKKIVTWKRGAQLSKNQITKNNSDIPTIHYADLYKYSEIINKTIHFSKLKIASTGDYGDLLFPMSDVTPDGLGRCSALKCRAQIGNDILIAHIKNNQLILSEYIAYYLSFNKQLILRLVTGTTVKHIKSSDLSSITIKSPDIDTQKILIQLLESVSKESNLMATRSKLLCTLKQFLLQNLFI